jgi:phosphonoacetate hydrolase
MNEHIHPTELASRAFNANGREYRCGPGCFVAVCLDGSADEYIEAAIARGLAPNLARMSVSGGRYRARSAMPSFTNPNNSSIITGVPPSVHGIGGNYFLDGATGRETMMNSGEYLRVPTILSAARGAGVRVGVVTAKDKLRTILGKGLDPREGGTISVSAERAHECTLDDSGLADPIGFAGSAQRPDIYSAGASLFVLSLGAAIVQQGLTDLLYLSTTDYIQHKHGPEEPEALEFYAAVDSQLGRLDALGAALAITADHGMSSKHGPDGEPRVVYLEPIVREIDAGSRVILPITDPHVVHHAALGSFAVIHLSHKNRVQPVIDRLWRIPGVTEVYPHDLACARFELPPDRTGDVVVASGRNVALGTSPERHDLSQLRGRLRSHGGRYEEMVPFIFNRPLLPTYADRARSDPRNFDLLDFLLNGMETVGNLPEPRP